MCDELDFSSLGLLRRGELLMSDGAVSRAVRSGRLHRLFPGIYARGDCDFDESARLRRAALLHAGDGARLSCGSACAEWGLSIPPLAAVHVTTEKRQVRRSPNLVAHRSKSTHSVLKVDVHVSPLEFAIVEAFSCLDVAARRELLISAIGGRRVLPERIRAAAPPGTSCRPALLALLDDVAGGSHSEAELALLHLIRAASLPEPKRQAPLVIEGRSIYIDLAYETERVAIEVDGRAWHFDAQQRTADIRRDAALGSIGWVVLRFVFEQIINEQQWVASRISATLAERRNRR